MAGEKRITTIAPKKELTESISGREKQLRVAAYCRVSTDQEEQQNSFEQQVAHYTEKINSNPNWTMVKVFADEGISGRQAKKRTEFMRMIKMCEKGKIDLVLTKSISRFARNTVDCLDYIRKLKALGIPIIFEKECINTMTMASEMAISLLGCFAQAESESLSQNVKWGKNQQAKSGKVTFQFKRYLGYDKGPDGQPIINEEQAQIARYIFQRYLDGLSVQKIKAELESKGILTATGKTEWSVGVLQYMLKNERLTGDALLGKTVTKDFLTGKVVKNNGEYPMYLVENNHPAIIDKDIFNRVQEEMARRGSKRKVSDKTAKTEQGKYSSKFALTELLFCAHCGTSYRRVTWSRKGVKRAVWRCVSRLDHGTKYCKESPTMFEHELHSAIMRAINQAAISRNRVIDLVTKSIEYALGTDSGETDILACESRIKELNEKMLTLVQESVVSGDLESYDERFEIISDEIKTLQEKVRVQNLKEMAQSCEVSRSLELIERLNDISLNLTEYDNILVKCLIASIKVVSKDKVIVYFKDGREIEQSLAG